ncbi:hypothetical protein LSTR_LSTR015653 [Laodelphax striatellus]|uniref:Uncharacterized protein n=1 Tax=Laodelphax striatellus TaxID=195883 RepID=A0A482XAC5_LAOST|nr:hypothetical protein LSTR_LSTR015653 [Laodelphax striatellus]
MDQSRSMGTGDGMRRRNENVVVVSCRQWGIDLYGMRTKGTSDMFWSSAPRISKDILFPFSNFADQFCPTFLRWTNYVGCLRRHFGPIYSIPSFSDNVYQREKQVSAFPTSLMDQYVGLRARHFWVPILYSFNFRTICTNDILSHIPELDAICRLHARHLVQLLTFLHFPTMCTSDILYHVSFRNIDLGKNIRLLELSSQLGV